VYDLFEIYKEKFGLKYDLGKPRISEKLHELMISKEEIPRVYYSNDNDCYLMHYKNIYNQVKIPNNEFSSGDAVITISELDKLLKKYNYYENI
jgi:UDP-glucose 4-epimerase